MSAVAAGRARLPRVLSIAGTDPTGGAGLQADLKSFEAAGAYGMGVVTALVAQNTQGVRSIHTPPVEFLRAQLDAVIDDVDIDAVKIGMLGSVEVVAEIDNFLRRLSRINSGAAVVLDPVMVASSGDRLLHPDAEDAVRELCRRATVITPNLPELAVLTRTEPTADLEVACATAADWARDTGVSVIVKGGHADGAADNIAVGPHGPIARARCPRVETTNTHGTGCSLSSALAARLGAGVDLAHALVWATDWIHEALLHADDLHVGRGRGPIDHGHRMRRLAGCAEHIPGIDR